MHAHRLGYTLLAGTSGSNAVNPALYGKRMPYEAGRDLRLVATLATVDNILVVRSDSRYRSVSDIIADAKSDPAKVTYASSGIGSVLLESAAQCGIAPTDDYNGTRQEGASYFQATIRNGKRVSAADAYLRPALNRPNLHVVTGALTQRINFSEGRACARSPERTAFLETLRPLVENGLVAVHWDGGDPSKGLDLRTVLKEPPPGTHLYYCGPPGFMSAVAAASAHWPGESVHREYFAPVSEPKFTDGGFGPPFLVKIASTGRIVEVPSDRSVLSVLRDHGIQIEAQCELGVCGTCRTRYLEGEPDHRDFVLEADEQNREMTVCCSRSKSLLLVLDL